MERLEAETSGNAGRLTGLDGLRGIAACIVAFGFHAQILFPRDSLIGTGPISDWLLVNGWTAVDLFFVLSGFVFAHVYLAKELLAGPGALKDFAIARLARLYPLHIVTLCLALAMFPAAQDNTGSAFLFHVLMLQALAEPVRHTFNGPAWSVSVEMFCYAAFVAAALAGRRALQIFTALAIVGGSAALLVQLPGDHPKVVESFARGFLGFFAGQLMWQWRVKLARIPTVVLVTVIAGGVLTADGAYCALLLALTSWPAAVMLALRSRWLEWHPLRWLGDRSYAIYLLHVPIIEGALGWTGPLRPDPIMVIVSYLCAIAAVLATADIVYRNFELPARRAIRTRWRNRPQLCASSAPA